jgi:hypothetical protein
LQVRSLTAACQQLRDAAAAGSAAAAEESRAAAALDTRQAQLLARCEDLGRRIRELGSLSAEVFEKYQGKGAKVRERASAVLVCWWFRMTHYFWQQGGGGSLADTSPPPKPPF